MLDRNITRAEFDETCDISSPSVTGYLKPAGRVPRADAVARIALAFDVDCNWLLLGVGGAGPVYRTTSRTQSALAADLGTHVAKRVADIIRKKPPFLDERYRHWTADGDELLEITVWTAVDSFRESRQWQRRAEEMEAVIALGGRGVRGLAPSGADARNRTDRRQVREAKSKLSPVALALLEDAVLELRKQQPQPQLATPDRVVRTDTTASAQSTPKRVAGRPKPRA
jgi:hypothetical protein